MTILNTNNLQLHGIKCSYWILRHIYSTRRGDPNRYSRLRVNLVLMAMEEYFTLPETLKLEPHHQMQVSVIPMSPTPCFFFFLSGGGISLLQRGIVSVFENPRSLMETAYKPMHWQNNFLKKFISLYILPRKEIILLWVQRVSLYHLKLIMVLPLVKLPYILVARYTFDLWN